ncbi:MAG: ParB/RepB/Spo0J family partition protein [Pseudomonadota bacterium]
MTKPNRGLGRGLDALLSGNVQQQGDVLRDLKIGQLQPGKFQPRSQMDETSLNELAASIKTQGVIQPILARLLQDDHYEIIAGERRWRAAQRAGLSRVPVLVRKVNDDDALVMALIENIQREELNPLEEAMGIQRLIDEFQMTHQTAADAVGRSRSAASNLLRLLKLTAPVRAMLMDGKLDMGHARALLGLDGAVQIATANKIILDGMSVRATEKMVQNELQPRAQQKPRPAPTRDIVRLQEQISDKLGAKVLIQHGVKGLGKLVIEYKTLDQLGGILASLGVSGDNR